MRTAVAATMLLVIGTTAAAQTVNMRLIAKNASAKLGGYRPQQLVLDAAAPAMLKKSPEMKSPVYGVLRVGPAGSETTVIVAIDEPGDSPARLFVDSNGNGDLTDDPAAEWAARTTKGKDGVDLTSYNGGANVVLRAGERTIEVAFGMYRFDKKDPSRQALANKVLYYGDYGLEGQVTLGGKTYDAMLADDLTGGDFRGKKDVKQGEQPRPVRFLLDVNKSGSFDSRGEAFDVAAPFNIGGTTYEIRNMDPFGGTFEIAVSEKKVDEVLPPPDLGLGKKVLPFEAKSTDGRVLKFPSDYKGKLVLVDFWATWCGPCVAELPNLIKAYGEFHGKGLEVLGISLDNADALSGKNGEPSKFESFLKDKGMTWTQIADGKGWKAEISQMYGIDSIPRVLLVDGDTGEILGTNRELRGEALGATVRKAIDRKNAQ
jgi:thiol-disulfide isomerase/thioredoxin